MEEVRGGYWNWNGRNGGMENGVDTAAMWSVLLFWSSFRCSRPPRRAAIRTHDTSHPLAPFDALFGVQSSGGGGGLPALLLGSISGQLQVLAVIRWVPHPEEIAHGTTGFATPSRHELLDGLLK
jgi:hypothetical protein